MTATKAIGKVVDNLIRAQQQRTLDLLSVPDKRTTVCFPHGVGLFAHVHWTGDRTTIHRTDIDCSCDGKLTTQLNSWSLIWTIRGDYTYKILRLPAIATCDLHRIACFAPCEQGMVIEFTRPKGGRRGKMKLRHVDQYEVPKSKANWVEANRILIRNLALIYDVPESVWTR